MFNGNSKKKKFLVCREVLAMGIVNKRREIFERNLNSGHRTGQMVGKLFGGGTSSHINCSRIEGH